MFGVFVGRVVLQRAYKLVASAKDQTSFLAITLLTVITMSGFTAALGLSDTLGAFLAGILLAETKYRYQVRHVGPELRLRPLPPPRPHTTHLDTDPTSPTRPTTRCPP